MDQLIQHTQTLSLSLSPPPSALSAFYVETPNSEFHSLSGCHLNPAPPLSDRLTLPPHIIDSTYVVCTYSIFQVVVPCCTYSSSYNSSYKLKSNVVRQTNPSFVIGTTARARDFAFQSCILLWRTLRAKSEHWSSCQVLGLIKSDVG